MKKTQTQPVAPAAAPLPATPPPAPRVAPAKPIPVYQPSCSGRVSFLLETASKKERDFFYALLDEWEEGAYDLTEAAFLNGATAQGITWISEIEDIAKDNEMFQGLRQVVNGNGWFANFLRRLLESYDYKNPLTPDNVADVLDGPLIAFHHEIEDARELIKSHPETVVNEIRKAMQNHPGLLSAA